MIERSALNAILVRVKRASERASKQYVHDACARGTVPVRNHHVGDGHSELVGDYSITSMVRRSSGAGSRIIIVYYDSIVYTA